MLVDLNWLKVPLLIAKLLSQLLHQIFVLCIMSLKLHYFVCLFLKETS